jgi:hypothetical protein
LRERHITAKRQPGEPVLDAVLAAPRKDLRAETDRETFDVRAAAARKWPSSWTKIEPPKKRTTRKSDQRLENRLCRRSMSGGVRD